MSMLLDVYFKGDVYDCVFLELRTAFAMFDQNHDGKVCREDLRASLSMLGYDGAEDVVDKIIQNGGNKGWTCYIRVFWDRQGQVNREVKTKD